MKNFTQTKHYLLLSLFFVLISNISFGQYSLTHYIPPSPWKYYNDSNELIVTTTSLTAVPITIRKSDGTLITNTVTTIVNAPLRYRFTTNIVQANLINTVYSDQGLIVSSTVPIGAQVRNIASDYTICAPFTTPADQCNCSQKGNTSFSSLGDQAYGTSFTLGYYRNFNNPDGCGVPAEPIAAPIYIVHSISNSNIVTYNGGTTVTLNAGQSFLFNAPFGSKVTSTKPISMLSSKRNDKTDGCGDGVINPVIPDNLLGDKYVINRSRGNSNYELSTIVSPTGGNTVTVQAYTVAGIASGPPATYVLAAGGSVTIKNGIDGGNDTNPGSSTFVSSTSPVIIYSGTAFGCEIDMITQAPLSGCSGSFDVQTKNFVKNTNTILPYFGYVIVQSGTAPVNFNGSSLEAVAGVGPRVQVGTTGFYKITFTNVQLGDPIDLRFNSTSRIAVAMIQSGGGYSMSNFITGFSSAYPPPTIDQAPACPAGTLLTANNTLGATFFQWEVNTGTGWTFIPSPAGIAPTLLTNITGLYRVAGNFPTCGYTEPSASVQVTALACPEVCNNQLDDDGDGYIDNADTDCGGSSSCAASTNPIFTENFGSGTQGFSPSVFSNSPGYTQVFTTPTPSQQSLYDDQFALINTITPGTFGVPGGSGLPPGSTIWHTGTDHTGNTNGYSYVVNGSENVGEFYRKTIPNLCPGSRYNFSIWVANLDTPAAQAAVGSPAIPPDLAITINNASNVIVAGLNTGSIIVQNALTWINYKFTFTAPAGLTSADLVIKNRATTVGFGNDFAIDDIVLGACVPVITATIDPTTPVCIGSAVKLTGTVAAGSYTTATYQWQYSTTATGPFSNIAGATSATYFIAPATVALAGFYRLITAESGNIANPNCVATSNVLSLVVNNCGGNRTEILCGASVVLTGPTGYTGYQWYSGTSPGGTPIAGAAGTAPNLTVTSIGSYYVVCTILPSISYTETITVNLFSGAPTTNPVIPFADILGPPCPNDGTQIPKIFLCGATATRAITTSLVNATVVWQQLVAASCPPSIPVTPVDCTKSYCPNSAWTTLATAPNFTVTQAGEYRVIVSYPSNGNCFVTYYFNAFQEFLTPTETHRDIICNLTGQIIVGSVPSTGYVFQILNQGTGVTTPSGNTFGTPSIFDPVAAGTYTISVKQIGGVAGSCVFKIPNVVIATRVFAVTPTVVQPKCNGDKGSIAVTVSGGNASTQYNYVLTQTSAPAGPANSLLATPLNTYTFANLNPGSYNLQTTSTDGCVDNYAFTLTNPPLLTLSVSTKSITCNPGEITMVGAGGTPPYTYQIPAVFGAANVTSPVSIPTAQTNVTVFVTDYNGCKATQIVDVPKIPDPVFLISTTNVLCYGTNSGSITVTVTNANGNSLMYSFDNGVTYGTSNVKNNLAPGTYQVIIKYTYNGIVCYTSAIEATITGPATALTATAGVSQLAGCGSGGTGEIRITNPQGGTPFINGAGLPYYEYQFPNGFGWVTTNSAFLSPGTYVVSIRDANGCVYDMTVTLDTIPSPPTFTVTPPAFACTGIATSTVTINNSTSSTYTYTYFLNGTANTPPTSNVFNNVPCGNQTIRVDYQLTNPPTYSNLLNEDFGVGSNTTTPGIAAAYCQNNQPFPAGQLCGVQPPFPNAVCGGVSLQPTIEDNQYDVTSAINPNNCNWFAYRDHTSSVVGPQNPNGRFLAVNIGSAAGANGILYSKTINNIIPNQPVKVELYVANLLKQNYVADNPDFILELVDPLTSTVVASQATGTILNTMDGWQFKAITLNPGANTTLKFNIRSGSIQYNGNDAAIDDIKVFQLPVSCINSATIQVPIACNQAFAAQVSSHTDLLCGGQNTGSITISAQNFALAPHTSFDYSLNGVAGPWFTSTTSPVVINNTGASPTTGPPSLAPGTYNILVSYDHLVAGTCEFSLPPVTITTPAVLVAGGSVTTQATCTNTATITATATGGTPNFMYQLLNSGSGTVAVAYQTSPVFNNVAPGTYFVQVKDANSCTNTSTTVLTVITATLPVASISASSTLCYTSATPASVVITASGGSGSGYTYQINSNGYVASGTFNGLIPGTYTFTVKDSNNCVSATVTQVIAPQLVATATLVKGLTCDTPAPAGNANITVTISGGTPGYTYQVNAGPVTATGSTINYSTPTAATYSFTITDSKGCTTTTSVTVSPLPVLNNPVVAITQGINCNGDSTGAISITNSGGSGTYTNNLVRNTPTTLIYGTQTSGLTAGTYTVTVTDGNNCTQSTNFTITEPSAITYNQTKTDITCGGGGITTLGTITASSVAGGTAPYTYILTGASSGNFGPTAALSHTFSNLTFGTYTLTVADANGCTKTVTPITIASPPNSLAINTTSTPATCTSGATIVVTVGATVIGTGPFFFAIYNNLSPAAPPYNTFPTGYFPADAGFPLQHTFTGLVPTVYTFIVYDSSTQCYYFQAAPNPGSTASNITTSVTPKNVTCKGSNDGSVTFTFQGYAASCTQVSYQIFDAQNVNIPVSPLVLATVSGGPVTITNFGSLPAGNYYILINEINGTNAGCSQATAPFTISESALALTLSDAHIVKNENCNNLGILSATAIGGTPPYQFQFQLSSAAAPTVATWVGTSNPYSAPAGSYDVYVKDANGCIVKYPSSLNLIKDIIPAITLTQPAATLCNTEGNFVIRVTQTAGTIAPFFYAINSSASSSYQPVPSNPFLISGLNSGLNTVYFKDANGCVTNQTIPIAAPIGATANVTFATPLNCGVSDGIITVSTTGGSGSFLYVLNPSPLGVVLTGNVFSNVPAGSYTVTVTDNVTNCFKTINVTIQAPTPVNYTTLTTPVSCNVGANSTNGSITINLPASNTNPPYTYTLVSGPVGPVYMVNQTTSTFNNLPAGTYVTQVTSASNCSTTVNNIVVGNATPIVVAATVTQFSCVANTNSNPNPNATITCPTGSVTGGTGTYINYVFSLGGTTLQTGASNVYNTTDPTGGNYTVTVFDSNGCSGTTNATINPFVQLGNTVGITVNTPVTCVSDETFTINPTVILNGGPAPTLVYTVSNQGPPFTVTQTNNPTFTLPIGIYTITVTNWATNCSVQTVHSINSPNNFRLDLQTTPASCFGGTGSVDITIIDTSVTPPSLGSAGAFNYTITPVSGGGTPIHSGSSATSGPTLDSPLKAGIYQASVTLINNPKCTVITNFTISQPLSDIIISSPITQAVTCTNNQGVISVNASGGTGPYTYSISPTPTSATWAQNAPGIFTGLNAYSTPGYVITVTDAKSCTKATAPIPFTLPPAINSGISASPNPLLCFGATNATITATGVSGGQGSNYSYQLVRTAPTPSTSVGFQISPSFPNQGAGTYYIIINDAFGCTFSTTPSITITEPSQLVPGTLSRQTDITCGNPPASNATLVVNGTTGGTAPYSYQLTNAAGTVIYGYGPLTTYTNIVAGTYRVSIKDANNCTVQLTNNLIVSPLVPLQVTVTNQPTLNCNGDTTSVTARALFGLSNYIYTLVDATTNAVVQGPIGPQLTLATFNGVPAGSYIIRVNSGNCTVDSQVINILQPLVFSVNATQTNVLCFGSNTGSINMAVTGGTGLIQYSIDPSTPNQYGTSGNFTGLSAGTYIVSYKDSKGCFGSRSFTITQPTTPLNVTSSSIQPACYDDKGTITLIASGGTITPNATNPTGGYTAVVGTEPSQNNTTGNFTFPMLLPGTYPIKVTDANGCLITDSQVIVAGIRMNQNYIIDYTCVVVNTTTGATAPANSVNIVVNPPSGTPTSDFSYNLDNTGDIYGSGTVYGHVYSSLAVGPHSVVVTYHYPGDPTLNCIRTVTFTIRPFTNPSVVLNNTNTGLNQFTILPTGGAPGYSITVNGVSVTNLTYLVSQTGWYTVVVTDSHGCIATDKIYMTFYDIVIPNFFTPNGDGTNSTWKPLYTDNFPNLITEVYDRYGRKIITLLKNETWDGKYNGNELPSGDYWYVIKLNISTDNREFVGNVTLYR